ncbi:MAG: rRNA maturation RNase YbeY [Frankia sp.]|nr:rRNA maturation RNase YbeY [Frankia sp.]
MAVFVANESTTTVDEVRLAELARHVLAEMHVHPLAELSVLLVDTGAMSRLHEKWMGEPGPTDVLAFPQDELDDRPHDDDAPPTLLGDVVICPDVAAEQAKTASHSLDDELHLLCTHGILHLLGFDHADATEHEQMFGEQARVLASWHARAS